MTRASFILALCLLLPVPAVSEEACTVEGTSNRIYMEPAPDHVGYCAPFAIRALIHQHRCSVDPTRCELPAVADIIHILNKLPKQDQSAYAVLKTISERGKLMDENCLKFGDIYPPSKNSTNEPRSFDDTYLQEIWNFSKPKLSPADQELMSLENKTQAQFQKFIDLRTKVLRQAELKFNGIVERSSCVRREIPPFEVIAPQTKSFGNRTAMSAALEKMLKAGQPVFLGLNLKPFGGFATGNHATAVVNFRHKCCMGKCWKQYQILDSAGVGWAPREEGNWVDESYLFELIPKDGAIISLKAKAQVTNKLSNAPKSNSETVK